MELSVAIQKYVEWKQIHSPIAAKTYPKYLNTFKTFSRKETLEELTVDDVTAYQSLLLKNYSDNTVRFASVAVRNFLKYWYGEGSSINVEKIKSPKASEEYRRPAITPEEFQWIDESLNEAEFWTLAERLVVRLLWETSVRVSELCSLSISQLDLTANGAQVMRKKNRHMRWVFWSQETTDLMRQYLGVRMCMNQDDALFIARSERGGRKRITAKTVQRWVRKACKRVGIVRHITPHSFRHGRALYILEQGGTVKDVQSVLGHSETNPAAAFAYLHWSKTEQEQHARKFLVDKPSSVPFTDKYYEQETSIRSHELLGAIEPQKITPQPGVLYPLRQKIITKTLGQKAKIKA